MLSFAHAEAVTSSAQQTVCQEQASASSLQTVTRCTVYSDAAHRHPLKYTQSLCTHNLLNQGSELQTLCTDTVRYANGQAQSASKLEVSRSVTYQKLQASVRH